MEIKDVKEAVEGAIKPLSEEVKGINDRLSAVEKLPAFNAPSIILTPKVYKGFNIAKQGALIRDAKLRGDLGKEENQDKFVKGMIDFITKTTLNETTDASGKYLVPDEFQWDLIELARQNCQALNICKVIPMARDDMYMPAELALGTVSWKAESAQMSLNDPTFSQVHLASSKLTAYASATNEMLEDCSQDVVGLLTKQFIYQMAVELDNQILNGTGTPVSGVLTAKAGYSVTVAISASISTLTAADLSLGISKLPEARLASARFIASRLAMHYIRSLSDTNKNPIFAMVGGTTPNTVYEFPINVNEKISTTDGVGTAHIVFGDFSRLLIGRRNGQMAIEANPYARFDYNETYFRMVTRWAFAYADATTNFVRFLVA